MLKFLNNMAGQVAFVNCYLMKICQHCNVLFWDELWKFIIHEYLNDQESEWPTGFCLFCPFPSYEVRRSSSQGKWRRASTFTQTGSFGLDSSFPIFEFFLNLVQRVLSDSVCRLSFLREVTLQKVSRMNFPLFLLHGVSAY